jgi:hypothetical protein
MSIMSPKLKIMKPALSDAIYFYRDRSDMCWVDEGGAEEAGEVSSGLGASVRGCYHSKSNRDQLAPSLCFNMASSSLIFGMSWRHLQHIPTAIPALKLESGHDLSSPVSSAGERS